MKRIIVVAAVVVFSGIWFSNPANAQGSKHSVTGTVVDVYCLVTMDMGGSDHKQCATTCAKNGSPLGIKEDKTRTLYLVAGQKDMLYASSGLEKYLETRVTARGEVYEKDGVKMLVVDSARPAK